MDMKRILQAFDNASTRPVEGANDMKKFVKAVAEANKAQSAASDNPFDDPNFKPILKVPKAPILPNVQLQPGDNQIGNGVMIRLNPDGTKTHNSGQGAFTFDKNNKPIKYQSPSFSGLSQTHDLVTGNIAVRYAAGPLDVSQSFDKTGKRLDTNVNYDLGTAVVGMGKNSKGTTTKSITSRDPNFDPDAKDLYAMGNKDKEATYDRAMAQVNKPTESQYMNENNLRKYLDIVERMPLPKIGADGQPDPADMEKLKTAMDQKQKISQQLSAQPQSIRQPTGKIDYTKDGPKTKSSQGVDLEYGVPVNKDGNFMNPQKLPNWDAHGDDEQFEMLQAYKAWLRDYTSRFPGAKQRPDGTWGMPGGLAPHAPSMPRLENASLKDYLQMVEEGYQEVSEEKRRLDPKCWKNKKIGNPKTKMKGGVRVNNCVPKE